VVRNRSVAVILSIAFGLLVCGILGMPQIQGKTADLHWYWVDIFLGPHHPRNSFPSWTREMYPEYLILYCWVAPVVIASLTVWLRSRSQLPMAKSGDSRVTIP
jgi:hypothetical protein